MAKTTRAAIVAILALAVGAAWAPLIAAKPASAPAAVIPLEPYLDGDHFVFRGKINGQDGLFQFDTGGGLTVVTPQSAAIAGCKPWGRFSGFRMRGDRLDLKRCDKVTIDAGGVRLTLPTTGVWDLTSILPKGAPPLAASVGLDAFAGRAVTLDIAGRRLIVETPQSLKARVADAKELPTHMVWEVEGYAPSAMIALDTPSGRSWCTLDSGSDGAIAIGRHIAADLGLDPDQKKGQPLAVTLPGGVALNGKAHVEDLILDCNIGTPILRTWVITFDVAHGRVWVTPNRTDARRDRIEAAAFPPSQPCCSTQPRSTNVRRDVMAYEGTCFCGAVTIEVSGSPEGMGYCHCESCRSWSGGPVNAFSLWKPEAVRITKGEDKIATYNKTEVSYRKFCTACGGHLMTDHPPLGLVDVFAATIPSLNF